jgi:FimV-like protein
VKKVKKITLLLNAFVMSGVVLSAFADAPFSTAPAPTQAYHMESSSITQPALSTQPVSQSVQSTPATASAAPAPFSQEAELTGASTATSDYLAQPATPATAQNEAAFDQSATQQIQNLNQSNQAMSAAIQTIDQNVAQLQQEVNVMQTTQVSKTSHAKQGFLRAFDRQDFDGFITFGGAAVFLLLLGVMIGRMMRRQPTMAIANHLSSHRVGDLLSDDTKSEYDFMGTKAAIPAKLDLARSYMAMNDHDQARAVLKTVMEKGNEEQRMVAEALLIKMHKSANEKSEK